MHFFVLFSRVPAWLPLTGIRGSREQTSDAPASVQCLSARPVHQHWPPVLWTTRWALPSTAVQPHRPVCIWELFPGTLPRGATYSHCTPPCQKHPQTTVHQPRRGRAAPAGGVRYLTQPGQTGQLRRGSDWTHRRLFSRQQRQDSRTPPALHGRLWDWGMRLQPGAWGWRGRGGDERACRAHGWRGARGAGLLW